MYITDYNTKRNEYRKRIRNLIIENENILESNDIKTMKKLINDENYHSLQEYKDIISQLTIRKNSIIPSNESPTKSSNNLEEGINEILIKLENYENKYPSNPRMKEIKIKIKEANNQIIPSVRFAQLKQILIDLEV